MKPKKNPKADLERKRPLFFQIGLAVVLSIVFFAFEWGMSPKPIEIPKGEPILGGELDVIPPTKPREPKNQKRHKAIILDIRSGEFDDDFDEFEFDVEDGFNATKMPVFEQTQEENVVESRVFLWPEQFPSFQGGEEARIMYLTENVKYPKLAAQLGIQGKVYVSFIVEPDGSISNVKLERGIGGGCDEESLRVVKSMPNWNPGIQGKTKVRVSLKMAINFALHKE